MLSRLLNTDYRLFHDLFSGRERNETMKGKCSYSQDPRNCSNAYEFCYDDFQLCDGIANCPNAEDEDLELCASRRFSPLDVVHCEKKNSNISFQIKATQCDGTVECKYGEDEAFCSLPSWISVAALAITFLMSSILYFWVQRSTLKDLKPTDTILKFSEEKFLGLHKTEALKILMHQIQGCSNSKELNRMYMALEIQHHNGSTCKTISCVKV